MENSEELYDISKADLSILIDKLENIGLITALDYRPLESRVQVMRVTNRLRKEFSSDLSYGGDYFGGDVVDSYFIYYENNNSGLTYEQAKLQFEKINKERNTNY